MSTDAYLPPGTSSNTVCHPVGVAGDAEHRGAPLGEQLRHRGAQSRRCAGDQCDFAVELTSWQDLLTGLGSGAPRPAALGRSGGTAASSARVYSCSGAANSSAAGRYSTASPSRITSTSWLIRCDDREVVGDEQVGQAQLALQVGEQIQHAGLHRNIQ